MSLKVSIIVPVYNVEIYLKRCVDSLLCQTYHNIEIILVDDGSTDDSGILCDEIASQNAVVKVIHKENGGLASARLAGFKISSGEYILFVDSDDYISKDMVEKLMYTAEKMRADLTICGYFTVNEGTIQKHSISLKKGLILERENIERQYVCPLIGPLKGDVALPGFLCIRLLRRNLIQESFFESERIYYKEDHVFDLLYSDHVKRIAIVNEPLYYYCYNSSSLSNRYRKNKWQMYRNLYTFYQSFAKERALEVAQRITNSLAGAVLATVDNAILTGSYKKFYMEVNGIVEDSLFQSYLQKKSLSGVAFSQVLIIWLLKLRMYHTLYLIRKKRVSCK